MGQRTDIFDVEKIRAAHGIEWNETLDTYRRLGSLAPITAGVTAGNANLPIHSRMRRCLVSDDLQTILYLQANDSTKLADGSAATLDGSAGQVMVEIPKFWYKYEVDETTPIKHRWLISEVELTGFEVHPAFIKGGVTRDYCYIGAYEGILYDASATRYANGKYLPVVCDATAKQVKFTDTAGVYTIELLGTTPYTGGFLGLEAGEKLVVTGSTSNNATFTIVSVDTGVKITVTESVTNETAVSGTVILSTQRDYTATTGDKLSSVNDKMPITYLTRANGRVLASNRGARWFQQDFDTTSAIQLLFLIEYGSFNSQTVLGAGITNVSGWDVYNNQNPIAISGNSNAIGDASGNNAGATSAATETTKYLSYRGIENFWGHLYKFVDGFSINSNAAYVHSTPSQYTDGSTTNYTLLGTLGNADGYARTLLRNKRGFLPTGVTGGSSAIALCDYYYQAADWRVALVGGYAAGGAGAGAWIWLLNNGSGSAFQYGGCRLACS